MPRPVALSVPGLTLVEEYLDAEEQQRLLSVVDALPWLEGTGIRRRVQHYGWRYDYSARSLDASLRLGPLPDWAAELAERIRRDGWKDKPADQVIVNEYLPGQGIAAHIDCVPCFDATVVSLSLGSACVMDFSDTATPQTAAVPLPAGSLLVMTGEARYRWKHGLAKRRRDRHDGQVFERSRRVSLTFRNVVTDFSTPAARSSGP